MRQRVGARRNQGDKRRQFCLKLGRHPHEIRIPGGFSKGDVQLGILSTKFDKIINQFTNLPNPLPKRGNLNFTCTFSGQFAYSCFKNETPVKKPGNVDLSSAVLFGSFLPLWRIVHHKGAAGPPTSRNKKPTRCQYLDGGPHCDPADTNYVSQIAFRGKLLSWLEKAEFY